MHLTALTTDHYVVKPAYNSQKEHENFLSSDMFLFNRGANLDKIINAQYILHVFMAQLRMLCCI